MGTDHRSSIMVNGRVLRYDGTPLSRREAEAALGMFAETGEVPPGYRIEATSWTRRGRRLRQPQSEQEARDAMVAFRAMLQQHGVARVRIGAVRALP